MPNAPVQILEVRAAERERPVTITAAITAEAGRAMVTALCEQLDRRRAEPAGSAEAVLALREHAALVECFEPIAAAGEHGIVRLSDAELRLCLLELSAYADRVDGEHFQPVELRDRLRLIAEIAPVLWDANVHAAAASEPLVHEAA